MKKADPQRRPAGQLSREFTTLSPAASTETAAAKTLPLPAKPAWRCDF
jgi:hypothetical protein